MFDFGGFVESRIMDAGMISDVTVVPLTFQSTADLTPAVKTIMAIKPVAKNIVILINNTAPEHVADLKTILAIRFPKMPIFVVNHSRHISRLADDGQTVFEIAASSGIEKWQLRNILPQVKKLYDYLDKHSS